MIGLNKVIAIVPARSGSKGIKNKNLRHINNIPLLAYPIITAKESKYVDYILFSSDSPEYCKIAKKYGASAPFLRPKSLSSDSSNRSDVIIHGLDFLKNNLNLEFDIILYLEPTSPLTNSEDVDKSIKMLYDNKIESLVSIVENHTCHPEYALKINSDSGIIKPFLNKSFKDLPTNRQELENIYFFDGSLYLSTVKSFYREKEFYHERTVGIELDGMKSVEIDTENDFELVEYFLNKME